MLIIKKEEQINDKALVKVAKVLNERRRNNVFHYKI